MTSCLKYCTSVTIEASWNPVKLISGQVRSQTEIQCVFQVIVTDFKNGRKQKRKTRTSLRAPETSSQAGLLLLFLDKERSVQRVKAPSATKMQEVIED